MRRICLLERGICFRAREICLRERKRIDCNDWLVGGGVWEKIACSKHSKWKEGMTSDGDVTCLEQKRPRQNRENSQQVKPSKLTCRFTVGAGLVVSAGEFVGLEASW